MICLTDMAFWMSNFDDFDIDQISWKPAQRKPFAFAFYSKIFFFLGNQEGSRNTKWNLFKNHPIHTTPTLVNNRIITWLSRTTRTQGRMNKRQSHDFVKTSELMYTRWRRTIAHCRSFIILCSSTPSLRICSASFRVMFSILFQIAMNVTFYHWGIHGWIVYSIVGAILGLVAYRKGQFKIQFNASPVY